MDNDEFISKIREADEKTIRAALQLTFNDVFEEIKKQPQNRGLPDIAIARMTARTVHLGLNEADPDNDWNISIVPSIKEAPKGKHENKKS